ncbi:unnamed protein product [Clonostachys rosea]|uniref:Uncharacterized protein n=1 Tax=Bionectria ochroleuca TaxID=29856 RepID=A0ABY6UJX5_BIOOC|nr:unnamed protein product [Clonostachys rosea]
MVITESVLSDFTTYLKNGGWDQQSLKSYLLTQIPKEGDHEALLIKSVPSLWALTIYFAQWPFNTAFEPTESLTLPALTRVVAFLCGRHYRMFQGWEGKDKELNRKSDQVILEYIFRALAITRPIEHESTPASPNEIFKSEIGHDAKTASNRDILDVLSVSQPWLSEWTTLLTLEELTPIANRLSPPTPSELSDLSISGGRLTSILELSILLLQHAGKFKGGTNVAERLKRKIETAYAELQKAGDISFVTFAKHFDVDDWKDHWNLTIYDAIALLFNTFTNPNSLRSGKVVNWSSGAEETLYLPQLRCLGLTVVEKSSVQH